MNFVNILKECEAANGSGSKLAIQLSLAKLNDTGRKLLTYAMDPYLVFGVKKFDRPAKYATEDTCDLTPFFMMLDDLAARNLTGDAARNAVTHALATFTEETASYLERVIDKDPRAGFSADTFNKVILAVGLGGELEASIKKIDKLLKTVGIAAVQSNINFSQRIPTFEVMLADKCEDTDDFEKYITFPCQADFKYDGQRTIAIVKEGFPVEYRARSGKESEHLNGLFDGELLAIRELIGYDFIMDGEAFASDFTETINAKKAGNDAAKKNLKLRCFFMMPLTDWIAQKTEITMEQNRVNLEKVLAEVKIPDSVQKVIISEGKIVNNYHEMMKYCNEAIDVHKQEGLILKELKAVYTWDRSFSWCKVKRFYDVDARIVGFYAGRPKSRLKNTVGGTHCVAFLESGERVEFNVGSGYGDKDREDMKKNPEKWLKATIVVKYQEVARSKNKAVASLRFGTFEHIRDDKLVEI